MKRVILVDFFDTIMFRHIHPFQVIKKWAELVVERFEFEKIDGENLFNLRQNLKKELLLKSEINEVRYDEWMSFLYQTLVKKEAKKMENIEQDYFMQICKEIEMAVEYGVQYPNVKLLKYLSKCKKDYKVCIVSDFYLSKNELILFMKSKNIDIELFDNIYCSHDYNATKENGKLYDIVLKDLGSVSNVIMIGDNYNNDYLKAKGHGIKSFFCPRIIYKLCMKMKKLCRYDYGKHMHYILIRDCKKYNKPFTEYILVFWYFIEKICKELEIDSKKKVIFLAREGYFLKRLFDWKNNVIAKKEDKIDSIYLKSSRRAIKTVSDADDEFFEIEISFYNYLIALGFTKSEIVAINSKYGISEQKQYEPCFLKKDEKFAEIIASIEFQKLLVCKKERNKEAFKAYLLNIDFENSEVIIDVGWKGTMQQGIENFTGKILQGYYLGIQGELQGRSINKKGIVFDEKITKSKIFHILHTNLQLYEHLLAAPHGSAQRYYLEQEKPKVDEEWADNEKELYEVYVEGIKESMFSLYQGIEAWCTKTSDDKMQKYLAKLVLKVACFNDRQRLDFLNASDKGFVWNFGQESKGINYKVEGKLIKADIIIHPERYVRYFAKIQRKLYQKPLINMLYYLIATVYYWYVRIMCGI